MAWLLRKVASAPSVEPGALAPAIELEPGTLVGESFRVVETIGEGGMGTVYLAHDVELDRNVALKVARRRRGHDALVRGVREARTMARLSHPNVVGVYEVGTHDDRLFIAMEFVGGFTARTWLAAKPRTWQEIVALYVEAGRGLLAAHREGVIHRDFKPENVLVDVDPEGGVGRARVADFGLARESLPTDSQERKLPTQDDLAAPISGRLTETGAAVGTPAYMAPEQHSGRGVDERADQFSFCIALWEALFATRPFAGDSVRELLNNIAIERFVEPKERRGVPRRVVKALQRGLSVERDQRFPSMRQLLIELGRDPRATQRRLAVAALVLGVGTVAFVAGGEDTVTCDRGAEEIAGSWGDPERHAVQGALLGVGKAYAEDAWTRVRDRLDAYAERWAGAYDDACAATHVRGEQSAQLLDDRNACLDHCRSRLDSVVERLSGVTSSSAVGAVSVAHGLPSIDACDDTPAFRERAPLPEDPQTRAQVEQLRGRSSTVRELVDSQQYWAALAAAEPLVARAEQLGWDPLISQAKADLAEVLDRGLFDGERATRLTREAFDAALAGRDHYAASRAAVRLVDGFAASEAAREEALRWAGTARAELSHVEDKGRAEINLEANLATIAAFSGDFDEALQHNRTAIELQKSHAPNAPRMSALLGNLAAIKMHAGMPAGEVIPDAEAAVAEAERTVGPNHPHVAVPLSNLANLYTAVGRAGEAEKRLRNALRVVRGAFGEGHPKETPLLASLAGCLTLQGKAQEGLELARLALRQFELRSGPDHAKPFDAQSEIVYALTRLGRNEEALEESRKLLGIAEKLPAGPVPRLALAHNGVANALVRLERYQEAIEHADISLADMDGRGDRDARGVFGALNAKGRALVAMGRPQPALAPLEEALRLAEERPEWANQVPYLRFALARALVDSGGDKARARQLVFTARDEANASGHPLYAQLLDNIERWLGDEGAL